ncbi:MAG: RluA family pseudouridine synthase [Halothiobacillaceae bacterium]
MTESRTVGVTDTDEPWTLVHEDEQLLVVGKPTRMLTVPGKAAHKKDCLIARVMREYPEARVVHRLDWDTSGLLVLARNARAHSRLSQAFMQRQVHKGYVALVDGQPDDERGLIELPLGPDPDPERKPRQCVRPDGRPATTRWQVLERAGDHCRLALWPVTGRAHQLRVHMLALGHPILGDSLYAPPSIQHRADRLMLHAQDLTFQHPVSGETLCLALPAPF